MSLLRKLFPNKNTNGAKKGAKKGTNNPPSSVNPQVKDRHALLRGRAHHYATVLLAVLVQNGMGPRDVQVVKFLPEPRYLALQLRVNNLARFQKVKKINEELFHATGAPAQFQMGDMGQVFFQFLLPSSYHTTYQLPEMPPGAIGLAMGGRPVRMFFDHAAPHAEIVGTSGSGKTTTQLSIIITLARIHTPEQLRFIIIDQKADLVEDLRNLEYLAYPIAVTDDEVAVAIDFTMAEFERRRTMPKSEREELPRWVVIVDEASQLDRIEKAAANMTNIAQLGRGLRMNLILGAQYPEDPTIRTISSEANNLFVGYVGDSYRSWRVSGQAGLRAHELTGEGDFISAHPKRGTSRFQAAQPTQADIDGLPRGELVITTNNHPPQVYIPTSAGEVQSVSVGGRPRLQLQPDVLAWYYVRGAELSGWKAARSMAGEFDDSVKITETVHKVHAPFMREFRAEVESYVEVQESEGQYE